VTLTRRRAIEYGLSTVAEVYNVSARKHGGKVEAVYFTKTPRDVAQVGVGALDRERGVAEGISPVPWQTDTCIGGWHFVYEQAFDVYTTLLTAAVLLPSGTGRAQSSDYLFLDRRRG